MRKWKAFRKFLSVMIAALLILPGAVKIDAAEAFYPIDAEDAVVLSAKIVGETSTNDHTYAKAIWTNGDFVYLMTDSTHDIKEVKLTAPGGVITAISYTAYATTDTVRVGDQVFAPDSSQGNTKDSHLTVAKFSLSEFLSTLGLNGGNTYGIEVISEQGKGHWIYGTLQITIPKAKAVVSKTWIDGPKYAASIDLYKDYKDETIPYTPTVASSFELTESQSTVTKEVNYTDNLGRVLTYFAEEKNIPEGYTATYSAVEKSFVDGFHVYKMSIENKYTPPLMNIEVTKTWKDEGGPLRPEEITFKLFRGQETEPIMTQTADVDSGWKTTFMNLPKTTLNGTAITYRVEEVPVPGYSTVIDGFTVINTRTEKFNLPVEKIWKDEPGTAMRPAAVTFNLLRNEIKVSEITFAANESWKGEFKNLDKFDGNGDLYTYSITENSVPGYMGSVNGFTITNTRTGVVDIPVMKIWKDINTSSRPDGITIHLIRNNAPYKTAEMKPVEGTWSYTFKDEPAFDSNGLPYTYKVEEVVPDGYKGSVVKNDNGSFTITNIRVNEITLLGEKTWLDDGTGRPESITVQLLQNGSPYRSAEVEPDEEGKWLFSFSKVPEFNEDGIPYIYSLKELTVEGYLADIEDNEDGTFTITNLRVGKVDVSGEKTWLDDGTGRPESITVNLLQNGYPVNSKEVTPNESGKWLFSFMDLDEFDMMGLPYTYSVEEVPVDGYKSTVKEKDDGTFEIENLREGLVDIAGRKTWKDAGPLSRPDFITVNLLRNGEEIMDKDVYPGEADVWSFIFEDLPEFDDKGIAYTYSITEEPVSGYASTVSEENGGILITNVRVNEINILGEKIWLDDNNPDRSESITIYLRRNGLEYKSVSVEADEEGNWSFAFMKVPEFDQDGLPYTYTIEEEDLDGYKETVKKNENGTYTVTNLLEGLVEISGEKTWLDNGTGRPETITIKLLRNNVEFDSKVVSEVNGKWMFYFLDLPEYDEDGKAYTYTIEEVPVEGYETSITMKQDGSYIVENLRTGVTSLSGRKIWLDDGNRESESIIVNLLRNGIKVDEASVSENEVGDWNFSFTNLPAFDEKGIAYVYTVTENAEEGYKTSILKEQDGTFTITNLREGFVDILGEKTWLDNGERSADTVRINLLRNGEPVDFRNVSEGQDGKWTFEFLELPEFDEEGILYTYTIEEEAVEGYTSTIRMNEDGSYTVENLRTGIVTVSGVKTWLDNGVRSIENIIINLLRDGQKVDEKSIPLGENGEASFSFENLPEFNEKGIAYTYTITEESVEGYKVKITEPRDNYFEVENLRTGIVDIEGDKVWLDDENPERPESITVKLLRNGEDYKSETITEEDGWSFSFLNEPEFDEKGIAYTYTIEEENLEGYSESVLKKEDGTFTVTNLRVGAIRVFGEKTWLDDENPERPESITLNLLRNGEISDSAVVSRGEDGKWTFSFDELPEFDEYGKAYVYTLEEEAVEGYSTNIDDLEDGEYLVTNLRVGTVDISGEKTWLDDETGRPVSIVINLLQNGEEIDEEIVTPNEEGAWSFSFNELPKFDDMGKAYEYTITEDSVEGYESTVTPNEDGSFTVENLRVGIVEVSGEKTWLDDETGRPESITVNLLRNGVFDRSLEVTDTEGAWSFSFTELPQFDEKGIPYTYTIEEVPVEGYESTVTPNEDGTFTITNLRVGITDVSGEKTWFDDGTGRPESITVNLIQNGEEIAEALVTPDGEGNWTYSFPELPEFDEEGIAYLYSITEDPVTGYNTNYVPGTYDIQNTREGIVNINGQKTWDDLFGRPASITVNLLQNGEEIREQVVTANASGLWLYSFTELPEFTEAGIPYVYTITEDAVPGYEATVTGTSILNRQLRATLSIIKIDDFDFPVEGAVFEITDEEGVVLFTGTTDEDGLLSAVLPLGTYIVSEISAPEDYIIDDTPKTVLLDEDGEVLELTVVNILEIEDVEPLPLPEEEEEEALPRTGSENVNYLYGLGLILILGGTVLLSKKKRTVK
ncbi:Cna B-type domain-containing protein [Proteiniclasticum ruminis]|uniref:LPXTG-motif cell wall anchor domain-containing protein n=1 Tax=Proteiniclasticum ruminis TaxID=398199 RepID=A0A1G8K4U2_9CLOT|nr:Cna B-type domain-containing protein [Proteiniclasticum ruminis]SDI38465.1 LPXTG-motif cell wall anchor domain-containing protein [Proteiniclasticum ruminis]